MRFKFNPLTFDQKLALRRSAEDSINAMNPLCWEFRKAATAPAIISLLDSLDEMTTYRDNAVNKIMRLRERITELEKQKPVTTRSITDIIAERQRQVTTKGWTPEHDDEHVNDEIAAFAALYAMPEACRDWPAKETGYGENWAEAICPNNWAAKFGDRRRELVKAGALILAEIERLDRVSNVKGENHE